MDSEKERIVFVLALVAFAVSSVFIGLSGIGQAAVHGEGKICTKEYMPVCGADGVTYGNECEAGETPIAHDGECGQTQEPGPSGWCGTVDEPSEKQDGRVCTAIYAPVCGADGITYGNACMAGENAIAYEGECR